MRRLINKASMRLNGLGIFLACSLGLVTGHTSAEDLKVACPEGEHGTALLVHVSNIRYLEGNLRAQIYGSNPDDFLSKGKKLFRIDVPVESDGEQDVCVPVPGPDTYALVIMHDRNANGKADFFTEGFGFSNNPKLKFSPPNAEEVMIKVSEGILEVPVELYYILGSDDGEAEKRRKMRRR